MRPAPAAPHSEWSRHGSEHITSNQQSAQLGVRVTRLLGGIARGDQSSLAGLFDLMAPRLLGGVGQLSPASDAETVVEKVFASIWERSRRLEFERVDPLDWMASIVREHLASTLTPPSAAETASQSIGASA